MMINNKPRGITFNKNALNIQQGLGLRNLPNNANNITNDNGKQQLANNNENLDDLKAAALSLENPQPFHLHKQANQEQQKQQLLDPIKRLTRLDFSKFNTIISDENADQPGPPKLIKPKDLKLVQEKQETPKQQPQQQQQLQPKPLAQIQLKPQPLPSLIPLPTDKLTEIEDIDKSTSRDAMFQVCDVAKDIYEYMYKLEEEQAIKEDYLKDQKILTPKVRHRLINWCIEIHNQLRLLPETLYMTVSVIDRYFDKVTVKQQNIVQLVAVGATLIASKYEEIYPPDVGDLIHLTQNAYSRRDIFRIEIDILETLNFDLGKPIPLAFLRRFSKAAHCDLKMHSIAKYLIELSLTEYECCHWKPSLLAAAALFITIHIVRQESSPTQSSTSASNRRFGVKRMSLMVTQSERWNRTLVHYTHYTKKQLQEPAGIICKILKRSQKSPSSYYCVKKNQANLLKWSELKSARVDQLIKLGDQNQ